MIKAFIAVGLVAVAPMIFAQNTPPARITSLTGIIKSHPGFESKILGNKRDILVYLPPDYEANKKASYPVLYLHDGQNVFDGATSYIPNEEWKADEAAEALIKSNLIEPIIIVAIPNAGMDRANEYLPTKWSPDEGIPERRKGDKGAPAYGGKADLYGRMLIEEIMPMINKTYRTKTGPKNTGLCGSSFGGVITMHLGFTRPDVFGKLGIFSPSLWWDHELMIKRAQALPKKFDTKIWTCSGTTQDTDLDQMVRLKAAFESHGWKLGKDLAWYIDGFSRHNERAWQNRFPAFLMFQYGKR